MVAYRVKKITAIKTGSLQDLGQSVVDLSKYTEDEFAFLASALQDPDPNTVLHVPPPKPRRGLIVTADGSNWNPGNGEGPYYFDGSTWKPLTAVAGAAPSTTLPLMDGVAAVGTSLFYARADHVHPSQPSDASKLNVAGGQTITGGFGITPANLGTISSGTVTPNPLTANYQFYTNNGAHTLAAPGSDCAIDVLVTNGASAGVITFSGYTVGSNVGDPLTTINTQKFIISIRRINSISTYVVKGLQ